MKPKYQHSGHDSHSADSCNQQTSPNGPISVVCIPPPLTDKEAAQKKNNQRRKAIKFWIEIAGVVILFGYFSFTILIWYASKKAADAAKQAADTATDTFKLSFRPRVEIVSVGAFRESRNGVIDNHVKDGFLTVQVGYVNRGPFTARNVRYFIYDSVGPIAIKGAYAGEARQFVQIPPTGGQTPNTYMTSTHSYSPSEIDGLIKGTLRATFSILFMYDDDLGKQTHHAEYCDVFTLDGANDFCPWPVQND
jgi:hypothetical protein